MVSTGLAFVAAATGLAGLVLVLPAERSVRRPTSVRFVLILASAGKRLRPPGAPADLRARIEAAGRPAGLGLRELMAAKVAASILAGAAALPFAALAPGRLGILIAAASPVAGFLAPDVWLARHAAERARRVRRELPALLDILRISIEAGGSLTWGLRAVGERAGGPLAREWRAVAREVALGVPLGQALDGLATRLPQPEVRAFVSAPTGPQGTALRCRRRSPARPARLASRLPAGSVRTPPAPARSSSSWWRCSSCRPSCCLSRRRWHRRCLTAAATRCRSSQGVGRFPLRNGSGRRPTPCTEPTKAPICTQDCGQIRALHPNRR